MMSFEFYILLVLLVIAVTLLFSGSFVYWYGRKFHPYHVQYPYEPEEWKGYFVSDVLFLSGFAAALLAIIFYLAVSFLFYDYSSLIY